MENEDFYAHMFDQNPRSRYLVVRSRLTEETLGRFMGS